MTEVDRYDYDLPEDLIAQYPIRSRSDSRMLVVDSRDSSIYESKFSELPYFLNSRDVMVYNDTRVINARFFGSRPSGGRVEFLFLRSVSRGHTYEVLSKPSRKLRPGDMVRLDIGRNGFDDQCENGSLDAQCENDRQSLKVAPFVEIIGDTGAGTKIIKAHVPGGLLQYLKKFGRVPLPPYIKHPLTDTSRYQTKYAKKYGSSAAPTAGLHFTKKIFDECDRIGIRRSTVTLNVGLGTFKPMDTEKVEDFKIHKEGYFVSEATAKLANGALAEGCKLLAVGTTSLRALESSVRNGKIVAGSGETELFIRPGHKFQTANMLLTNFHLPRTTLLVLVTEFGGYELVMKAYKQAIADRFRCLSFGDAMLVIR